MVKIPHSKLITDLQQQSLGARASPLKLSEVENLQQLK